MVLSKNTNNGAVKMSDMKVTTIKAKREFFDNMKEAAGREGRSVNNFMVWVLTNYAKEAKKKEAAE